MAIFGTSIGLLSLLGLRIKHKPSILGSDVSLAIYAFWISVNHLFHLYHIFTLLLNKHYLLWCTWHVPFPSPPAQRIPSVKLSPFAFIFLLHLVFEAIWTYEKYIWIECLEKNCNLGFLENIRVIVCCHLHKSPSCIKSWHEAAWSLQARLVGLDDSESAFFWDCSVSNQNPRTTWDNFGTTSGQLWDKRQLWDHFGTLLGQLSDKFMATLGHFWHNPYKAMGKL